MIINHVSDNPVFLITGVMAAGKSTIAELLAQRFPKSVHLRNILLLNYKVSKQLIITMQL